MTTWQGYPEGRYGTSELRYRAGMPVLELAGTPEEMGAALARLAVHPAERMTRYPEELMRSFWVGWLGGLLNRWGERMVAGFPEDYRREFESMVASGVPRRRLVLGNTLFDLKKFLACSALLVEGERSATGTPLVGRNLDYPDLGYAHEYTLVTVHRPRGKKAFVSVGFPGLIGVLSGMNEDGLVANTLEVFQLAWGMRRLDRRGVPYALCIRRLLEECATIDEAYELLRRQRRATIHNLVLADRERVEVLEVTPTRVVRRPAIRGVAMCTNHFHAPALRPFWPFNVYGTFDRLRKLVRLERKHARFGVAELQSAMHEVCKADETLQSMVFDPVGMRLHLATGTLPATRGEWRVLEVGELMRGGPVGAAVAVAAS